MDGTGDYNLTWNKSVSQRQACFLSYVELGVGKKHESERERLLEMSQVKIGRGKWNMWMEWIWPKYIIDIYGNVAMEAFV